MSECDLCLFVYQAVAPPYATGPCEYASGEWPNEVRAGPCAYVLRRGGDANSGSAKSGACSMIGVGAITVL